MKLKILFISFLLFSPFILSQNYKILESNSEYIKIEFNFENYYKIKDTLFEGRKYSFITGDDYAFRKPGEPWLPTVYLNIGIPFNSKPQLKILSLDQKNIPQVFIIPYPDSLNQPIEKLEFSETIYNSNYFFPKLPVNIESTFIMRYARMAGLMVSPYQFNPVSREVIFNKKIIMKIDYTIDQNTIQSFSRVSDQMTNDIVKSSVVNPKEAINFTGKILNNIFKPVSSDTVWYDPQKDYYKIYLKEKGLYKITYDQLISAGVPENTGLQQGKLEIINNGIQIPLDIIDVDNNGTFNSGDYFKFVGNPPKPATPYEYYNIYNIENVYWFSYQADSVYSYKHIDGFPVNIVDEINTTIKTIHYEKDRWYERLGYAPDDKRDFWLWEDAEARDSSEFRIFLYWIIDSLYYSIREAFPEIKVRVNMQGISNVTCSYAKSHNAFVRFNGVDIGEKQWDAQNSSLLETSFNIQTPSVPNGIVLHSDQNKFEVGLNGRTCDGNDNIRVNWFELDYWRWNRVRNNNFIFTSPPNRFGRNFYYLWQWYSNNMKVYVPSRGEVISNPQILNDNDLAVRFTDSISAQTEYYCYSDEAFLTPDSVVKDQTSDLRSIANGADYIIITHPKFMSVAERLASFRSANLSGYSSARVKIVNVFDIYDEFSYGLLDPNSLNYFVKYTFENWQSPAPAYIALLGDMSYDYRPIYVSNRPNFIPSIPYQSIEFGQAPSDNLIAAVAGEDIVPDLAIGRISCETVEEGNILLDKIINYPADNSKAWKQNVLLMASGLSNSDETQFGFNDKSLDLDKNYIIPNGFTSTKVFRYPNKPEHFPFQGEGPQIRAGFNKGAVIANYYGHGGGGQWDLVFTNDDIYQLENGGRLPVVFSVTCYTAHFDNQDIFGEKFNKVPGKGSVGFFGSSGLTWWEAGVLINNSIFNEVFKNKNYVLGKAILVAKNLVPNIGFISSQIALLTLLGDPALELAFPKHPDFEIKSSDISILPQNPLKDDTVSVSIKFRNLGVAFEGDSVSVRLFENVADEAHLIGQKKLGSFGESVETMITWIPKEAGLFTLLVYVNDVDIIQEDDVSDNATSADFAVYSFGEPNIVKPINGFFSTNNQISFIFSDVGSLFEKNFKYFVEIDTSIELNSSFKVKSPELSPVNGTVIWKSPALQEGEYFWKATIYDEADTNYSELKTFSVSSQAGIGYYIKNKQLKFFSTQNINYSDSLNSLLLNTELLPPRPSEKRLLDTVNISLAPTDSGITTFTTDGSYFYYSHISFYKNGGLSKIYKIGTGLNGTERGKNYGAIPNVDIIIKNQIFYHSDGFIYAATGEINSLLRINPVTGDTLRVFIPDGLLPSLDGLIRNSGFYITSDGQYVYNLSPGYGELRNKYILRKFDPSQGWIKVGDDIVLFGTSDQGFSGFFVTNGYLETLESINPGYMRRYKVSNGSFEEEWLSFFPSKDFYTICYDWNNNYVYISTFRPNNIPHQPAFFRFTGTYQEAVGSIVSQQIGPALKWETIHYDLDKTGSTGNYEVFLLGKNNATQNWDTLRSNILNDIPISDINANDYRYLKLSFDLVDSSFGASAPMKLKSVLVNYLSFPEISLSNDEFSFSADTLLQGFPVDMNLMVHNLGYAVIDSLHLNFLNNGADSAFYSPVISIQPDSSKLIHLTLPTNNLIFNNNIKVVASSSEPEFYSFNNLAEGKFFISRDSINPVFTITIDGKEVVNGDIVSPNPEIIIALKDNSPLPLEGGLFTVIYSHDNRSEPLNLYNNPDIQIDSIPYPNSEYRINWKPKLPDGKHTLEILAKDASGNFFDTTSSRTFFYVYSTPDLKNVYNYPNPFKEDTYFTFELSSILPHQLYIRIYTVAGRLINSLDIPQNLLKPGFNRVYWNGRDNDGDEVANGVYFYKIVAKINDVIKTEIQKIAKVK